jgi:hypothetical protein
VQGRRSAAQPAGSGGFRTNGEGVPEDAVMAQVAGDDTVDIQADTWAGSRVPGVPWQVIYPPEFLDASVAICDNGRGKLLNNRHQGEKNRHEGTRARRHVVVQRQG